MNSSSFLLTDINLNYFIFIILNYFIDYHLTYEKIKDTERNIVADVIIFLLRDIVQH